MGFKESRLKTYYSLQEMQELFLSNGGIGAAFDEVPYIKLFMAKYCSQYSIIEPQFKADGFGFVFPLDSPLVSDISRQILNLTEGEMMKAMENKWLVGEKLCPETTTLDSPIQLDHHSFKALFSIVFGFSLILLLVKVVVGKRCVSLLLLLVKVVVGKRWQERQVDQINAALTPQPQPQVQTVNAGDNGQGQDHANTVRYRNGAAVQD